MRNCVWGIMVCCLSLISCKSETKVIERIGNASYKVVTDSIYSSMPGSIFYQKGYLYWHDAISSENIIHVLDVETGSEIASFGNIGMGPKEFVQPILSLSFYNGLYLTDLEKGLRALAKINSETDSLELFFQSCRKEELVTDLLHVYDDVSLYFKPDNDKPFELCLDGFIYQGGNWPIQEKIINGFEVFQGAISYNTQNSCLVYSTYAFPYTAVYKLRNNEISLLKEIKFNVNYSIAQNELKLDKDNPKGIIELGLTNKYIVMLQRDVEVEGELPKAKYSRDISTLPHSLFIYDYELNLKKVINMPFPMLRLCGDVMTNKIYVMSVNPEYALICFDLEHLL